MIRTLIVFVMLSLLCQGKEFRFDYGYDEMADGWLKLHVVPSTWREARMRCHAEGAVLASPLTKQLKQSIITFVQKKYSVPTALFIGVHATFSKGDYTSIDGTPLTRLPITWAEGEPDNLGNAESCLVMLTDDGGSTADKRCDDVFPYVCYKKFKQLNITECGTIDPEYKLDKRTGSCYKFHRRGLAWSQAFMTCLAEGGHLAIINNGVEQEVVREIFRNNPHKTIQSTDPGVLGMGFHDWGEHMTFMTIHGETLDEAGFQKWAAYQPDNATRHRSNDLGESCGTVFRDVLFNDVWCNVPIPFLCEKRVDSLLNADFQLSYY